VRSSFASSSLLALGSASQQLCCQAGLVFSYCTTVARRDAPPLAGARCVVVSVCRVAQRKPLPLHANERHLIMSSQRLSLVG